MGKARTGALIVLEQAVSLQEYERTGISIDSLVSSQLILNIFEKNTPLHDGAVIMSGNRIRSATCYLPLSDNMTLSKALGTRHRAAVGVSEVNDSLTIVVSEETGSVSVARGGRLLRNLNQEQLKKQLQALQPKTDDSRKIRLWKRTGERMKAKIFDNLLFKILALLMAVLLWVVVVNIDDAVSYKEDQWCEGQSDQYRCADVPGSDNPGGRGNRYRESDGLCPFLCVKESESRGFFLPLRM